MPQADFFRDPIILHKKSSSGTDIAEFAKEAMSALMERINHFYRDTILHLINHNSVGIRAINIVIHLPLLIFYNHRIFPTKKIIKVIKH